MEGLREAQIEGLLPALHFKPSAQSEATVKSFLSALRKFILSLPADREFQPPTLISLVGSHVLQLRSTTETPNADLLVQLPKGFITQADLKNAVYFQKRDRYLNWLQKRLSKQTEYKCTIKTILNSDLKKILVLQKPLEGLEVRIHVALSADSFSGASLAPSKNMVSVASLGLVSRVQESATANYNSILLSEMHHNAHLMLLNSAKSQIKNFAKAVILLKAWIGHKRLLNGFVISVVAASLCKSGTILPEASAFCIFMETVKFIASATWSHNEFPPEFPVFLAQGGEMLNLLVFWQAGDLAMLSAWAKYSLEIMNIYEFHLERAFAKLFTGDSLCLWDREYCLTGLEKAKFESKKFLGFFAGAGGDRTLAIHHWVPWMLQKCLSNRILYVAVSRIDHCSMTLQIKWAAEEQAKALIERGPLAEQSNDAAFFRSLWGSCAELRRFADGSIYESVACPDSGSMDPFTWFVATLLLNHAAIDAASISCRGECSFSAILPTCDLSFSLKGSFSQFILTLKDLALSNGLAINSVYPLDAVFRGTRIDSLEHKARPDSFYQAYRVLVEFDTTKCKWPESLEIQKAYKILLLGKLKSVLESSKAFKQGKQIIFPFQLSSDPFLDVYYEHHYFRLELFVPPSDQQGSSYCLMEAFKFVSSLSVTQSQAFPALCRMVKEWLDYQLLFCHLGPERDLVVECWVGKILLQTCSLPLSIDRLFEHLIASASEIFTDEMPFECGVGTTNYKAISMFLKQELAPSRAFSLKRIHFLASQHCMGTLAVNTLAVGDFTGVFHKRQAKRRVAEEALGNFNNEQALIDRVRVAFKDCLFFWNVLDYSTLAITVLRGDKIAIMNEIRSVICEFYE